MGGGAAPSCPSLSHMELSEQATAEGGRIPQRMDVSNRAAPEVTEPSRHPCLTHGKPAADAPFSFSSPPATPRPGSASFRQRAVTQAFTVQHPATRYSEVSLRNISPRAYHSDKHLSPTSTLGRSRAGRRWAAHGLHPSHPPW